MIHCGDCGNKQSPVYVHIDADLSCTGSEKWRWYLIDECLVPFVDALQKAGINMRGSCCGHGIGYGQINLSDGRMLRLYPETKEKA